MDFALLVWDFMNLLSKMGFILFIQLHTILHQIAKLNMQ